MTAFRRGCKSCDECGARHQTRDKHLTCPLCGAYSLHHHRNNGGRVVWCKATDAIWPTAPLVAKAGGILETCRLLGIEKRTIPTHINDVQSDQWAIRCGWHPNQVWPDWSDAGLRYVDRVFLESGWRQAWLQWERTTNKAEEAA